MFFTYTIVKKDTSGGMIFKSDSLKVDDFVEKKNIVKQFTVSWLSLGK